MMHNIGEQKHMQDVTNTVGTRVVPKTIFYLEP